MTVWSSGDIDSVTNEYAPDQFIVAAASEVGIISRSAESQTPTGSVTG
jgi:hypothetical protein